MARGGLGSYLSRLRSRGGTLPRPEAWAAVAQAHARAVAESRGGEDGADKRAQAVNGWARGGVGGCLARLLGWRG